MNREIKFRAWNKKTLLMIDLKKVTPLALDDDLVMDGLNGLFLPFDENIVLMQYTGVKDKNGKEIYEGDIIEYPEHYALSSSDYLEKAGCAKVEFWDLEFCLIDKFREWHGLWNIVENYSGVVVGNIFENGELLK